MRRLLALCLSVMPAMTTAEEFRDQDWQLLAIDGILFDADAALRIDADGVISGKAPCNSWSVVNQATFPALELTAIRATRMACDQLTEEQAFFDALGAMTALAMDGPKNLILTGPNRRTMEFILATVSSLPQCKTCPP
jgi:heat shock protein HslJ